MFRFASLVGSILLDVLGLGLIVAGTWMIWEPLGLITAGAAVLVYAAVLEGS